MVTALVRIVRGCVAWLREASSLVIELLALALVGVGVGMVSVPAALIVMGVAVILAIETSA
ncbi:hypothetical protein [Haloactinopolyspora sp.]|uniref:hypothetical protein n=1 Tax=Haloactinopolyspora sp. TaxID=1966353 RepID=UPI0026100FE3|nr:hypothetical protein [Haloactinopolyspora sp.]